MRLSLLSRRLFAKAASTALLGMLPALIYAQAQPTRSPSGVSPPPVPSMPQPGVGPPPMPPPGFPMPVRPVLPTLPAAPKSAWVEREQRQFQALLRDAKSNYFIAPIQVAGSAFDRSTRSLIALELASAIAAADAGSPLLNPSYVQRALGDGVRTFSDTEIRPLAEAVGASKVLVLAIGHDGKGTATVNMRWRIAGRTKLIGGYESRVFQFPIKAEETVAETFKREVLPEVLRTFELAPPRPVAVAGNHTFTRLPATLAAAFKDANTHPLNECVFYQLLGAVAPLQPERARESLYERSVVCLKRYVTSDPVQRYLTAKAVFELHSRPAAIAILGQAKTNAEQALAAMMNGNLADAEKAVSGIDHELLRLMLELDLVDLKRIYKVPMKDFMPDKVRQILKGKPEWEVLVGRRLGELDRWQTQDNIEIKALLDRVLPIKTFDLETIVQGARAIKSDLDEVQLGMSSLEHIARVRRADADSQLCASPRATCFRGAFLDLVEAIVVANPARAIELDGVTRGSSDSALAMGKRYSPYLDGQPEFALAISRVLLASADRLAPERRGQQLVASREAALMATHWGLGQSQTTRAAMIQLGVPSPDSNPFLELYSRDHPIRSYWFTPMMGGSADSLPQVWARLSQASTQIDAAGDIARNFMASTADKTRVAAEIVGRFVGHPERNALASSLPAPAGTVAVQKGDVNPRVAEYEAAIKDRPDIWENYRRYGLYVINERGDVAAAAVIFGRFPGFKDQRGYNSVGLSNQAYDAGSMFFWRGAIAETLPLYRFSAGLRTGSAASISSEARLALLDGKFEKAAELSLQRASRYDDAYAYRDYISWLFAFGKKREAWAAFDSLQSKLENPQVWLAAHVGHRSQGSTWEQMRDWLKSEPVRSTIVEGIQPALAAALQLSIIDRSPSSDLPDVMRAIEGKPRASYTGYSVMLPRVDGAYPDATSGSALKGPDTPKPEIGPVASDLVMFADAYLLLHRKEFSAAAAKFAGMAAYYPITGVSFKPYFAYALPYFAWASAKSGDKNQLEAFLKKQQVAHFEEFDHHLARAIFSGLRGEESEAIASLQRAFNNRPYTERRPIFTEYQWAQICEWLFIETGGKKYRDLALNWAKLNQKIQPMYAWAYAMEAKLTSSEPERLRALGIALYLDPRSARALSFPEATRLAAKKLVESRNPFLTDKSGEAKPRVVASAGTGVAKPAGAQLPPSLR
ncbi:MAG: hypothetical protein LW865_16315 [Betaproteobacteria bacterium]|nr:hypothetical protein [Betaproteobacteria bacterium]